MSLASFAFSAAKPLWLCINISLHPRAQFIEFLKASGLYPEEMAGSSVESMVSGNGHFKWIDKNNLVVS